MASNSRVHSGAEHGGATLNKDTDTSARPYQGYWTVPGSIHEAPEYVIPKESFRSSGVKLSPQQRSNIKRGKSRLG